METTRDEVTGHPVKIRMLKPSDMHHHLRQDDLLKLVMPMAARRFYNILVMPNTAPPITTGKLMDEYYTKIGEAGGDRDDYWLLMTCYLTDTLDPKQIATDLNAGDFCGVKYYPKGLTTNSDSGVTNPSSLWTQGTVPYDVLRAIEDSNATLLLHAADGFDKNGNELDPYDQEKHFLAETLPRIIDAHPDLRISVEHLSTKEGVEFMERVAPTRKGLLGCSLTAHHLLLDRRDVFRGGFRPHRSWWPIIQPSEHKEALREFAKKGHPFVWLGSDSAPHPVNKKEADCCMGGVLTAHAGIELYVEAFEDMGCLDKLEAFASLNGPRFFHTPAAGHENLYIELVREEWEVPSFFIGQYVSAGGYSPVVPFRLGEMVRWKLVTP